MTYVSQMAVIEHLKDELKMCWWEMSFYRDEIIFMFIVLLMNTPKILGLCVLFLFVILLVVRFDECIVCNKYRVYVYNPFQHKWQCWKRHSIHEIYWAYKRRANTI